jgi:hypothetical protein
MVNPRSASIDSNLCEGGADDGGGLVYLRRAGNFVRGNEDIIANSDIGKPHSSWL